MELQNQTEREIIYLLEKTEIFSFRNETMFDFISLK